MAFVDEITIHARAGKGGDGVVRWLHEKNKEFGGPAGGNGGKGGDVYVRAVRDLSLLSRYRAIKEFAAEPGENGAKSSMHGHDGEDLFIQVPVGSVIRDLGRDKTYELFSEGVTAKLLRGGHGGLGNEHFKSSTNIRPTESTPGREGESGDFLIEIRLGVDAGFVGLPNAGKSSLLNALTAARAKIGSYPFTTLEPNLGELHGYILADIPGLIEGASEGRGLGHKFLRHVRRTKLLIHCVSLEGDRPWAAYETVRAELSTYDETLAKKPEVVVLTKSDTRSRGEIESITRSFEGVPSAIYIVSVLDDDSVKRLSDGLVRSLRDLETEPE